jgi:hypothetical protein
MPLMRPHATPHIATLVAGLMSLTLVACASNDKKKDDAAALGYAIMKRDGETLYCKRAIATGSYIVKNTRCKTAKEWEQVYDNDQKTLDEMRRVPPAPPPPTS